MKAKQTRSRLRRLLRAELALSQKHGINIERGSLGKAATVPLDDLLAAAACAWTAARESAASLPDPPERVNGVSVAIWY